MPKDEELERLRRRRMSELIKRLRVKEEEKERILRIVLTDRAWEVLKVAERQYPEPTCQIERILAHLIAAGEPNRSVESSCCGFSGT